MSLAAPAPQIVTTRDAFSSAVNPAQPPSKPSVTREWSKKLFTSPLGQAIVGGIVVGVVLWILNPPMVQSKQKNESGSDMQHPVRDSKKVLIWVGVTSAIILAAPFVVKFIRSRMHKTQT